MTNVLIMNGTGGSGKGTVVEYLNELFELNIKEYSSINYVKAVAKISFDWNGEKDIAGRNLLATIKQTMITFNDLPTKKVIGQIEWADHHDVDILVVDIREPDEIEKLVTYCSLQGIQCVTCRVINKKLEIEAEKNGLSLTGDRLYGKYDYDVEIDNNGTLEELKQNVKIIFEDVYNNPRPKGKIGRKCDMCRGTGILKVPDGLSGECNACNGTGWLKPREEGPLINHTIDSMKYALKAMSGTVDVIKGSNENKSHLPFSSLHHGRTCSVCDSENVFMSYNAMVCDYCGQKYNHQF